VPKTLITGGAGFLGSYLCDRFILEGHEVICMDNLLTGNAENIEHLIGLNTFSFINYDVTNYLQVEGDLDYILHFASPASPLDYLKYPIQTLKVGALGTLNALGLAKAKNARFLLASTSEVYGDPEVHPQPEDYWGSVNSIGVRGVYDEAKRYAEAMTMAYHRYHGVETRIVRIFNTFGPRMRLNDGRALPNFMSQALTGQPLSLFGDGQQTRSFCFVDDLIEGLFRLLNSDITTPVNIGNPEEITVETLAREIIEMSGSDSELSFHPLPQDDPKVRRPDITKARTELGWSPKITREEGLKKTLAYFRKEIQKAAVREERAES